MTPSAIDQTVQPVLVTKSVGKMENASLMDELTGICQVDIDTMDSSYASQIKGKPCDMTSNQFLMAAMLCDPKNEKVVEKVIAEKGHLGWKSVFCQCAALFCKEVVDHIRGRVLVQVSPRGSYDAEDMVSWAREYATCFESVGISKDRFAIKIPTTGAGMNAAKQLEQEGIRCLGTAMFSIPQAIAASQANCYAISPYYNEIKVHAQPELRPQTKDTLLDHPMSNRIAQIRYVYDLQKQKSGKPQPQMKPASFVEWQEVFACAMLGSENVTVLPPVLDQMIDLKTKVDQNKRDPKSDISKEINVLLSSDPLSNDPQAFSKEDLFKPFETDLLANNGSALDAANEADKSTKQRLSDALELFCSFEDQCKVFIEEKINALKA